MRLLSLAALALATLATASDVTKLRRLMVDSRFISIISPCSTGGRNRNNAAEWLRVAFHDGAAHNAATGLGGIDGSIQYELEYEEDSGVAFSSVMLQYKFYQQEGVTLSDIIALGAIVSVGSCNGPMIPFYHGRTEALVEAGEGFVPGPEESTESHMEKFSRMGFTRAETIALVACGHTLGGVHAANHPTITDNVYAPLDGSIAAFDNLIATDHVLGISNSPLGQPYDPAFPERSSDSRLFSSDGNATITAMAESNAKFNEMCNVAISKLLNTAIPSSVTLEGPLVPFPVSTTFRLTMRNGVMGISIGSSRVYNMVGQWSSFEVGYTNRDGSVASGAMTVRALRTLSIGEPVEIRDFNAQNIPAATGIGSIFVTLTMNDGSVYSSAEGEEVREIDDSIMIDNGNAFSCQYSGEANNNAKGLNITMAVLGPYNAGDRVEVILRAAPAIGTKKYVRASFRAARDEYYNYYNVFIPDYEAFGVVSVGAQVTRTNGKVSVDTRDDIYYTLNSFSRCIAGAEVPPPGPTPSGELTRRRSPVNRIKEAAKPCASGFSLCGDRCVDTASDLEHCGGCAGIGGVDCTTLSDGAIACVMGKCVALVEEEDF